MAAIADVDTILGLMDDPAIERTTNLYMITRKKDGNTFNYNVLTAETLNEVADELNVIFTNHLTKIKKQHKEFRNYDIDDSSNEYVQYIGQDAVSNASTIMVPIENNSADVFISDLETFGNLWAYAVKIEFDNNKLVWFRKYSKGKVLKKGFKDAVLFKDGKFSKVEHDIFQIDEKVDCFAWNGEIYISQHNNFEKIFSFEDYYEEKVEEALEAFNEAFTYIDHDSLKTYVETDSMQKRKLASIIKNGVFEKYGFNEVATTIEKYGLDIAVDEQEQKIKISQKDSRRFLKILNDDYLRSEVTKIRYESITKRKGSN